jgi:hypothetical protein
MRWLITVFLVLSNLWFAPDAMATSLPQRIAEFPRWSLATNLIREGDLTYPEWFAGEWTATSTLREQVAPLAPDVVTPGFERNKVNIDRPYSFQVRFGSTTNTVAPGITVAAEKSVVITSDRTFNGEQIANAYLGVNAVKSIQTINQPQIVQITRLQNGTELRSTVSGYLSESITEGASEAIGVDSFATTEIDQQVFQGKTTYLNTVETTTNYHLVSQHHIAAEQVTAIYLSPQDPDYFKALQRPVALYRYTLELKS